MTSAARVEAVESEEDRIIEAMEKFAAALGAKVVINQDNLEIFLGRGKKMAPKAVIVDDPIVKDVIRRVAERSETGLKKYGVTMLRDDVSTIEWLRHAQEEALDFAVYIERVIHDLKEKKSND